MSDTQKKTLYAVIIGLIIVFIGYRLYLVIQGWERLPQQQIQSYNVPITPPVPITPCTDNKC